MIWPDFKKQFDDMIDATANKLEGSETTPITEAKHFK